VLTRLHSLRSWSKTHQGRKLIRYTMVSGSSTIVSFVALSAFYGLNIIRASSGQPSRQSRRFDPGLSTQSPLDVGQARQEPVPARGVPFWALTFLGIGVSNSALSGRATKCAPITGVISPTLDSSSLPTWRASPSSGC